MDLDALEVFVTVAQARGFSKAAERLNRTQPGISQAIGRLERELGECLFDRSSRDAILTPGGEVLYEYALQLLDLRKNAVTQIKELRDFRRGKLVVGANEYTVTYLLPTLVKFHNAHPEVKIEVKRSLGRNIPSEVLNRQVELGVTSYRPSLGGLKVLPCIEDETVLIVNVEHPLATFDEVSIEDLRSEEFIAQSVASPYRSRTIHMFETGNIHPNITIELPTLEAIKLGVRNNLGIAFMPKLTALSEIENGQLKALSVREINLQRRLYLLSKAEATMSHAARAFLSLMRQAREERSIASGRKNLQKPKSVKD
jgi:DNA-binding transcriptional LysR family regulator